MLITILLAVSIGMTSTAGQHPRHTMAGVWVANPQRSDFGTVASADQVLLSVEEADQALAICEITTAHEKRRIAYRQVARDKERCQLDDSAALPSVQACRFETGMGSEEDWRLSELDELVIDRSINVGLRVVHQHLVLNRSTRLPD